jgi:hypothetical protein
VEIHQAEYNLRENLNVCIDSRLRAWSVHGASRELCVENAKIYHTQAPKRACIDLGILLAAPRHR